MLSVFVRLDGGLFASHADTSSHTRGADELGSLIDVQSKASPRLRRARVSFPPFSFVTLMSCPEDLVTLSLGEAAPMSGNRALQTVLKLDRYGH